MPSQLSNGYFNFILDWYSLQRFRGCSSEVEHQLPKLRTRVRFPSPAPLGECTTKCCLGAQPHVNELAPRPNLALGASSLHRSRVARQFTVISGGQSSFTRMPVTGDGAPVTQSSCSQLHLVVRVLERAVSRHLELHHRHQRSRRSARGARSSPPLTCLRNSDGPFFHNNVTATMGTVAERVGRNRRDPIDTLQAHNN